MSIGVPLKILHEAEGHIITCETVDGEVYRGKLVEAEDSMNLQMTNISVTHRDGSVTGMQGCFLRGSKIVFVTMPDILKHAPVFNKTTNKGSSSAQAPTTNILKARGRGLGRNRPTSSRRPKQ
uniref:Small nuclear ribonucleoprotein Sm D3 n=1 Tax=Aceria tosichella TaxID=561515 RepID=A0A6G1SBF7_9ACAR